MVEASSRLTRKWRYGRATPRTRDDVERFFAGFEILEPGIVPPDRWRPDDPPVMEGFWLWVGVGVKHPMR